MAVTQSRPKRKISGGRYIANRKKKLHETGSQPIMTKVDEPKKKAVRVRGANVKQKLLSQNIVNVSDGKKVKKTTIKSVSENPANRNFVRRSILTKGTIIETELGKARITSRPRSRWRCECGFG